MSKTPYWTKVIDRAIAKADAGQEPFTPAQIERAGDWVTCACGKQDDRLLDQDYGCPSDDRLRSLGHRFTHALWGQEPHKARSILAQIEKRAAVLLREIATRG